MKFGFDFEVVRLAFRPAGIALVVAGVIAGVLEGKSVHSASMAVALGVVVICCTAISRRE